MIIVTKGKANVLKRHTVTERNEGKCHSQRRGEGREIKNERERRAEK